MTITLLFLCRATAHPNGLVTTACATSNCAALRDCAQYHFESATVLFAARCGSDPSERSSFSAKLLGSSKPMATGSSSMMPRA